MQVILGLLHRSPEHRIVLSYLFIYFVYIMVSNILSMNFVDDHEEFWLVLQKNLGSFLLWNNYQTLISEH